MGSIAPVPDYKLYLSPEFIETEADFTGLKTSIVCAGDVRTFENFIADVPPDMSPQAYA